MHSLGVCGLLASCTWTLGRFVRCSESIVAEDAATYTWTQWGLFVICCVFRYHYVRRWGYLRVNRRGIWSGVVCSIAMIGIISGEVPIYSKLASRVLYQRYTWGDSVKSCIYHSIQQRQEIERNGDPLLVFIVETTPDLLIGICSCI